MDVLEVVQRYFSHAPVPPSEVAVDNQAEVSGLWKAIRHGDLAELRRLVEEEGHSLACRGPVGETALHYSFLLQNDLDGTSRRRFSAAFKGSWLAQRADLERIITLMRIVLACSFMKELAS